MDLQQNNSRRSRLLILSSSSSTKCTATMRTILVGLLIISLLLCQSDSYVLKICQNEQEPFSLTCERNKGINITDYLVSYVAKGQPDHDCYSKPTYQTSSKKLLLEMIGYCSAAPNEYLCTLSSTGANDLFYRNYEITDANLFLVPISIEIVYDCQNSTRGNGAARTSNLVAVQPLFMSLLFATLFVAATNVVFLL